MFIALIKKTYSFLNITIISTLKLFALNINNDLKVLHMVFLYLHKLVFYFCIDDILIYLVF